MSRQPTRTVWARNRCLTAAPVEQAAARAVAAAAVWPRTSRCPCALATLQAVALAVGTVQVVPEPEAVIG